PALVEMGGVPLRVCRPDDLGDGVGEVLVPPLRRSAELRDLGLAPLALDLLEELRLPPDLLAAPIELDEDGYLRLHHVGIDRLHDEVHAADLVRVVDALDVSARRGQE